MGFTRFTTDVQNITPLPNKMQNQADVLKALFDKAGVDIKTALNALLVELEASTAATSIGAKDGEVNTTVQAALNSIKVLLADRYTKNETGALIGENTNNLIEDFNINLNTGVITITKKDGTIETIDTAMEKIPATFTFVENGGA